MIGISRYFVFIMSDGFLPQKLLIRLGQKLYSSDLDKNCILLISIKPPFRGTYVGIVVTIPYRKGILKKRQAVLLRNNTD